MSPIEARPALRGHLHALMFLLSIPAGLFLLAVAADTTSERIAVGVYGVSLLALFGTSASYHLLARGPRARSVMQRVDHAMIYLLIAGTYTPVCLLALPRGWGIPILVFVAIGGAVGAVIKLTAFSTIGPYASGLYLVLGWAAAVAAPVLSQSLTQVELLLLVGGGLAYTIGFPVLLLRRPDPWPRVFGYHEIWHAFTVVAALAHFGLVASLVHTGS